MKSSVSIFILFLFSTHSMFGQGYNPVGVKIDEGALSLPAGTQAVTDVTADGGKSIQRLSTGPNATMWYGPYNTFQAGNYLVQFRLKVASNTSSAYLCTIDVASGVGGIAPAALAIRPSNFRNSGEWQLFTIPVRIDNNASAIETRCINFAPGVTDLYLDYINILPGDMRGIYSNEFTVDGKGNVGIGTITPSNTLTIDPKGPGGLLIGNSNSETGGYTNVSLGISAQSGGNARLQVAKASGTAFGDLFINANGGNVGIGTLDTKGYQLAVNGSAVFTKVVVKAATNWPDYVFDSSYHLPSLASVAAFIQTNKHLPGIAPAAEIQQHGLDLSDNQAALLQKQEELTLYIIDQDKQMKVLQQQLEKQKALIELLQKKMLQLKPNRHNHRS